MGIFSAVADAVTGGLPTLLSRAIDKVLPDQQTPEQKAQWAQLELELTKAAHEHEIALLTKANEADAEFNRRIQAMEGTASDLNGAGWPGKVILLLRGAFRPACSYVVLWMDYRYGQAAGWHFEAGGDSTFMLLLNVTVLGFWFGERAIRNVMPAIAEFAERKQQK